MDELQLIPLHSRPELLEECEALLHSQWPQAHAARRRMLTQSSDSFPCCLVLIDGSPTTPIVIGHSRVGRVLGQNDAFWIKSGLNDMFSRLKGEIILSVVIRNDYRGKGFGKFLMLKTEEFAKKRGYVHSYLTTIDQQGFYRRIGYEYCQPVCFIGHSSFAHKLTLKLGDHSTGSCNKMDPLVDNNRNNNVTNLKSINTTLPTAPSSPSSPLPPPPPPPPPPPLPPPSGNPNLSQGETGPGILSGKTWMRKSLVA